MAATRPPRTVRLLDDRISFRLHTRTVLIWAGLLLVAVCTSVIGLALGDYRVSIGDILGALFGTSTPRLEMVIVEWRLPRVLMAALFGAMLALSGAVFQSLTRNPLGSPDVIGFNMGAYTGVLLTMLLGGTGFLLIAGGALAGGILTALLVYLLAFRQGVQGFRLIIVGIAVSMMLAAVNTWITVKVDVEFAMGAAVWGAGTIHGATWDELAPSAALGAILMALLALTSRRMRILEFGDEIAHAHGQRVERMRLALIVIGVALTAVVTATAGPISFVALAAPQIARRMTGESGIPLLSSALVGACLLSIADLIAQHALPTLSLPVGAVTVSLGGLYLVWLLAREPKNY